MRWARSAAAVATVVLTTSGCLGQGDHPSLADQQRRADANITAVVKALDAGLENPRWGGPLGEFRRCGGSLPMAEYAVRGSVTADDLSFARVQTLLQDADLDVQQGEDRVLFVGSGAARVRIYPPSAALDPVTDITVEGECQVRSGDDLEEHDGERIDFADLLGLTRYEFGQ